MSKDDSRKAPGVVAPSTRVTIAFPFSAVKSQEPSAELRELAVLVAQMTETLAKLDPSAGTDELVQHARTLLTKLG
jgi:hypothetical protein